ncbi:MAG: cytochrome c [Akkermansia sp.]|nr:cytochrome c [Akkermansia sp.]
MKYRLTIIITLALILTAAALWRIDFDRTGQPARIVFDTPAEELSTRRPHPKDSIPFGEAPDTPTDSGPELFTAHCAHCHGADGSGNSYVSRYPGMPSVGNLTASERTQEEQHLIIKEGRGAMPPFSSRLSPADIRALLQLIHSIITPQS